MWLNLYKKRHDTNPTVNVKRFIDKVLELKADVIGSI